MKKVSKILLIVSLLFMGTVAIINAAETKPVAPKTTVSLANVTLKNPLKAEYGTFSQLVAGVTRAAVTVFIPFVVIAFIYSGWIFVKAQGKEKEITDAKNALLWSVVGAFILLGASVFAKIIGTTVSTITNI